MGYKGENGNKVLAPKLQASKILSQWETLGAVHHIPKSIPHKRKKMQVCIYQLRHQLKSCYFWLPFMLKHTCFILNIVSLCLLIYLYTYLFVCILCIDFFLYLFVYSWVHACEQLSGDCFLLPTCALLGLNSESRRVLLPMEPSCCSL